MQKIQKAAASFVYGKYVFIEDVLKLNWLPVKQQLEWHIKIMHKALYDLNWPKHWDLKRFKHKRTLRSSTRVSSEIPLISSSNFQHQVASSFNELPIILQNCKEYKQFSRDTFKYLSQATRDNLLSRYRVHYFY